MSSMVTRLLEARGWGSDAWEYFYQAGLPIVASLCYIALRGVRFAGSVCGLHGGTAVGGVGAEG